MAPTSPIMQYLDQLRQARQSLAARYQVEMLGVFGSYVRNQQHEGSDLDILVTFSEPPSLFRLVALQDELSALLGIPVDLVMKTSLKPSTGQHILKEMVEV